MVQQALWDAHFAALSALDSGTLGLLFRAWDYNPCDSVWHDKSLFSGVNVSANVGTFLLTVASSSGFGVVGLSVRILTLTVLPQTVTALHTTSNCVCFKRSVV